MSSSSDGGAGALCLTTDIESASTSALCPSKQTQRIRSSCYNYSAYTPQNWTRPLASCIVKPDESAGMPWSTYPHRNNDVTYEAQPRLNFTNHQLPNIQNTEPHKVHARRGLLLLLGESGMWLHPFHHGRKWPAPIDVRANHHPIPPFSTPKPDPMLAAFKRGTIQPFNTMLLPTQWCIINARVQSTLLLKI